MTASELPDELTLFSDDQGNLSSWLPQGDKHYAASKWRKVSSAETPPPAPKPVTWPDDKARVQQEAYVQGLRNGAETLRSMRATEGVLCNRTMNLAATVLEDAARAALLLAAADKVEGRG